MFYLPLNQTLFYTCTDLPNLTYHDFYKIDIKFRINVKYRILFFNKLNHYAVLETGPEIIIFSIGYQFCHFLLKQHFNASFLKRGIFLENFYKTLNIVDGSHEFPVDLVII